MMVSAASRRVIGLGIGGFLAKATDRGLGMMPTRGGSGDGSAQSYRSICFGLTSRLSSFPTTARPDMQGTVIQADPQVMGGTPVFAGTRVPVVTLIDYLEAGDSIDDFLAGFPSVRHDRVIGFLEEIREKTLVAA
jgi:uncharacterized protein (DUF433 family)